MDWMPSMKRFIAELEEMLNHLRNGNRGFSM